MNENSKQWTKAILAVGLLMFAQLALGSETTGIADLDKQGTTWQQSLGYVAKYGGIGFAVIMALMLGFGKAQGQTATLLASGGIALGLLSAAWSYFGDNFAHGFVF